MGMWHQEDYVRLWFKYVWLVICITVWILIWCWCIVYQWLLHDLTARIDCTMSELDFSFRIDCERGWCRSCSTFWSEFTDWCFQYKLIWCYLREWSKEGDFFFFQYLWYCTTEYIDSLIMFNHFRFLFETYSRLQKFIFI